MSAVAGVPETPGPEIAKVADGGQPTRPAGGRGNLAGRVYLERGNPVTVLTSWGPGGGPRNVEIERGDGTRVVRPFRGLRKPKPEGV